MVNKYFVYTILPIFALYTSHQAAQKCCVNLKTPTVMQMQKKTVQKMLVKLSQERGWGKWEGEKDATENVFSLRRR